MSLNIQRNDTVEVIAGSDKGKRGRVLRVLVDENRVLVEHVRVIKKNVRPNPQRNIKGGIAEQEAPVRDVHVHRGFLLGNAALMFRCGRTLLLIWPHARQAFDLHKDWQQRDRACPVPGKHFPAWCTVCSN